METQHATQLLNFAVMAFSETTEEKDRLKLGQVVTDLRETLPNLLQTDL